ncbi:MAG TPA: lysophospholipid acyltransferase family protein [Wenzhouxiangella sp.]
MKLRRLQRRLAFYGLRSLAHLAAQGGPSRLKDWGMRLGSADYWLRPRLRQNLSSQLQTLATSHASRALSSDPQGILKSAYQVNDRALLEIIAMYASKRPPKHLLPDITVQRSGVLDACLEENSGVVMLGMHMGNGVALASHLNRSHGPIHVVYRESNKVPPGFFKHGIERLGLTAINASGPGAGFRDMLKALKSGHIVFILMDQGSKRSGIAVEFLGKQMQMPQGPVELARRTGAPIVPVLLTGVNTAWAFEICDPIHLPAKEPIENQVSQISRLMAEHVLSHPQWWSWHQRRWRKLPFQSMMTGVP